MPEKQDKGTGNIVAGVGATAYGAANAPVLRGGSKDMSRMQNASPKKQAGRYQGELHQAMKQGKVASDSPVHVLRTPSGRHINAGGTHRQIAREAMNKPSEYQIKDIKHEIHVSPAQKVKGRLKVAALQRGSKRAEAGKNIKAVGTTARAANQRLAAGADVADARLWAHPSALSGPVKLGRKAGLIGAGAIAGAGALSTAVGAHQRHEWKKTHPVSKARLMSDTEIKHRKKIQGRISQTTSTLGLTGLGITGAAALAARKTPGGAKVLGAVRKLPKMKNATPEKMKNAAINTGIVSGGIGGVGGFNFASYTNAESRKRNMQPAVKKSYEPGIDMGYFGEEGHPIKLPVIEVPIEKAWEPSAGKFDSEKSRGKRAKAYEAGAYGVAGAGAGVAGHQGYKAGKEATKLKGALKGEQMAPLKERKMRTGGGSKMKRLGVSPDPAKPGHILHETAIPKKGIDVAAKVGEHGGRAAGAAALAGGALYAAHKIKEKSKSGGSWAPYAKRDAVSAFGIDHSH